MKNIGTKLAGLFLFAILALYLCSYQVRFTETAIKLRWGKPHGEPIDKPGLYFKYPEPIEKVVKYDKRTRILEDKAEESRTRDGRNILLTTYTLWQIKDPAKFLQRFPDDVENGAKKLRTSIITHKQAVTGSRSLEEFISTNPNVRALDEIEQEMMQAVQVEVSDAYGIEIVAFGIKKLGLPESVTTSIFTQMKSNEEKKAQKFVAEGNARARKIIAEAKATEARILAAAQRKVAEITNEAQRKVGEYYKEFDQYPQLRIFLDKLRTAQQALKNRSTIILSTEDENSPLNVFSQEMRDRVPQLDGLTHFDEDVEGSVDTASGPAASNTQGG